MPTLIRPHTYQIGDDFYVLSPGTYDPADPASIEAAINAIRAQITAGPPPLPSPPPSGEARQQRHLQKLVKTDPTRALLISTGLKKR